ncbi:MAG TPA: hypothetical protein VD967_02865 [Candidatus Paceibacterota bacterium]|nr:hypothetical protein [Candidatus Paceibacterota bacterium]
MKQKTFNTVTGAIFAVVAVVHLLRAINGWEVSIDTFAVPMAVSWLGILLAGYLAYWGLKKLN